MTSVEFMEFMGELDDELIDSKEKTVSKEKWRRWIALAACITLVFTLGLAWYYGNTVELGSGDTVYFQWQIGPLSADKVFYEFDIRERDLTEAEVVALLDEIPVQGAMGVFNEEDQTLFQMEGKINDAVELMVLADERYVPIRLMGVEDIKYTSEVNGVSVSAGYMMYNKRIVYYAICKLGNSTVYLESEGWWNEREAVRSKLTDALEAVIAHGAIDLNCVRM